MNGRRAALPSLWLCVLAFSYALHCRSAEPSLPPKPATYFSDQAGIVSGDVAAFINERLESFERETSNQFLVTIYSKLPEGAALEDYTVRTAQSWGTGQKKKSNGIILFVFVGDRKMRIEVGYGLEGVLPDSVCASIIRDVIAPQFKSGAYGSALENGVDAIIRATKGEYQGTGRTVADRSPHGIPVPTWIIILLIIVFLIWIHTGDTMFQRAGRFLFWNIVNMAFSSSSGGGSSSSSSSGYSGGGGSFGGGGASGSW